MSSLTSNRTWFARHKVLTGVCAAAVVLTIAACGGGSKSTSGSSTGTSSNGAPQSTGKPAQNKPAGIDGDGTYKVGTDIKPGLYKSVGNKDDECYWEREKNATGDANSILANDNVTGTTYVTIKASDKYFKSSSCNDWVTASAAGGQILTQLPGDGMYKVGTDIKAGTYKSTGNTDDNCYWERAKDATGDANSLLANDNASGTVVVTIKASDSFFKSAGCKAWTKS